jgi:hypothetical protein
VDLPCSGSWETLSGVATRAPAPKGASHPWPPRRRTSDAPHSRGTAARATGRGARRAAARRPRGPGSSQAGEPHTARRPRRAPAHPAQPRGQKARACGALHSGRRGCARRAARRVTTGLGFGLGFGPLSPAPRAQCAAPDAKALARPATQAGCGTERAEQQHGWCVFVLAAAAAVRLAAQASALGAPARAARPQSTPRDAT